MQILTSTSLPSGINTSVAGGNGGAYSGTPGNQTKGGNGSNGTVNIIIFN
jgi:hypothetical protein